MKRMLVGMVDDFVLWGSPGVLMLVGFLLGGPIGLPIGLIAGVGVSVWYFFWARQRASRGH